MAVDALTLVVRFVHILSGIAWIGGSMLMSLVVARSLAEAPPAIRGPAMVRIGLAGSQYLIWAGASTIVFGAIYQVMVTQEADPGSTWQMLIGTALLLAVAMMGIGSVMIRGGIKKLAALPPPAAGSPPPAEAMAAQKRIMTGSAIALGLGLIAVFLMVYATKIRVY